ncbi:Cobyric acid synthase [Austwickia sp. TVS 96-490-7B]|uniref:cobyric acid synthase n=1 Tax=Austwickia sp. TVS 96-490-7B TaxID=2830843 RepID=UPI001C575ACA|nr:cobyric acid synthase [Austwickia sp. TVS 96-490-7B]MBW3084983.1 Cobyric acid synthase [Austwickia sp. TVS 96-490-7B]
MAGVLIAGTTSDAGKSLVVTGLCRAWARRGIDVVPFKAQNMSNNSMVCADGSEIGRAQYLQALAARVEPTSAMNPVLLKPGTDRRSFVVLRGQPAGRLEAGEYATGRRHLAEAAWAAYDELAATHDLVVCEGAGSPAEINLRAGDYTNLGLATHCGLPVVLVGDIDRGGLLASLYGHWAILDDADRALLAGYVVNKFRGDVDVLRPGLEEITRRTGMRSYGVLPWLDGVWLDGEDALDLGAWRAHRTDDEVDADAVLRVAVVAFPRTSNATDVDALAHEAGVDVVVTRDPGRVRDADLVVLPGSRSTIADLDWLRRTGLADAVISRVAAGRPTLGICGGYQMLAVHIDDENGVESSSGHRADSGGVPGLGLLPVHVVFGADKHLGRPRGTWRGHHVVGYEIHHGVCEPLEGTETDVEPFLDGYHRGPVWGTLWHGALENDSFRRAWLTEIAQSVGSTWQPHPDTPGFTQRRETMIDDLADAVEEHLDLAALYDLAQQARTR